MACLLVLCSTVVAEPLDDSQFAAPAGWPTDDDGRPIAAPAAERWSIDMTARAIGSFELATGSPRDRPGIVPNLAMRAEKKLGWLSLGGTLAVGFPAYLGQHELALSADIDHVLLRSGERTTSIGAGFDGGVELYFFDAPPLMEGPSDALMYWGPLGRTRVQLRITDRLPSGAQVGVVIGAGAAITRAHFMAVDGVGWRVEPSLEVGVAVKR